MSLPWERIDDFLLGCGEIRTPERFACEVLNDIGDLIPFDQGRLYFLDDNGNVDHEYLLGVDETVVREYLDYYSKCDDGSFSTAHVAARFSQHYPAVEQCIIDRGSFNPKSRFFSEYVQPNNIRYSFGLGLRDTTGSLRCMFSLDRTSNQRYSAEEVEIMKRIRPHLDNLYQNFYVAPTDTATRRADAQPYQALTPREEEVATLLVQGITPTNIARKLCISFTTVNKHIANMHAKLHVSTRQELIVKLMSARVA